MDKVTYEAVSEARRLADAQGAPVAAVVFGSGVDEAALAALGQYGIALLDERRHRRC